MKFNKRLLSYAVMAAVVVPAGFVLTSTTASAAEPYYSTHTVYSSDSPVTIDGTSTIDYEVTSENGIAEWNLAGVNAGAYTGKTSGSTSSANVTTTDNVTDTTVTDSSAKAGTSWTADLAE